MIFIETPIFTDDVKALLSDDEYRAFQQFMAQNPQAGDVITETGGLRKVRWKLEGGGKRGGVRVIYFHVVAASQIRLVMIYQKGVKDDLTKDEKKALRKIIERWK
ncbi:hypothetical protein SAMN05216600_11821 [Pseudomonas cuatrocienegasensis]|uniref:RelE toxin of RelE / RelB toxin-antitoxin system n=1 Tax=Pseudomonas cuatrocienegasensis TaxID=543360 RepID=A0ABY1BMT7_9PSED|nr:MULTISPECIES: hypothetical protein [Pseudomonas]OEC32719.1 hypothetical protein A7D25_22570 [Pseudomonas sp. 21C1]SER21662.1 hypothetical protein SAMN05216600_11821 [Pseudomonas cuatrocienegasensis]